jgi:hypothetical protein
LSLLGRAIISCLSPLSITLLGIRPHLQLRQIDAALREGVAKPR